MKCSSNMGGNSSLNMEGRLWKKLATLKVFWMYNDQKFVLNEKHHEFGAIFIRIAFTGWKEFMDEKCLSSQFLIRGQQIQFVKGQTLNCFCLGQFYGSGWNYTQPLCKARTENHKWMSMAVFQKNIFLCTLKFVSYYILCHKLWFLVQPKM